MKAEPTLNTGQRLNYNLFLLQLGKSTRMVLGQEEPKVLRKVSQFVLSRKSSVISRHRERYESVGGGSCVSAVDSANFKGSQISINTTAGKIF